MVVSHKRADREPDFGHAFLTSSVAVQPPFRWMRSDGVAGECPEWQRELTVNQPSYDFEGSSPSSPTILIPQRFLPLGDFVCKQSVSNPVSNHGFPVRSHQAPPRFRGDF